MIDLIVNLISTTYCDSDSYVDKPRVIDCSFDCRLW